ncbi:OsmC family peroxiredoxin [Fodinibius saliphilus]|uniref:OsmC family peroxiredoxin n=1 Tax=Fodinibius saliphilus TaxID=1920650 RepID=UPI001108ECE0|nr:OsmC family peroxiredoxin [Fodinibius saliphilus]
MPVRKSEAQWNGNFQDGEGSMKIVNGTTFNENYSYASQFEDGLGSNPEELIAAAHAGCYSMALSDTLAKANYNPKKVNTKAEVIFEVTNNGAAISAIKLQCTADVPNIDITEFLKYAEGAKAECPVSKALSVTDISLEAELL